MPALIGYRPRTRPFRRTSPAGRSPDRLPGTPGSRHGGRGRCFRQSAVHVVLNLLSKLDGRVNVLLGSDGSSEPHRGGQPIARQAAIEPKGVGERVDLLDPEAGEGAAEVVDQGSASMMCRTSAAIHWLAAERKRIEVRETPRRRCLLDRVEQVPDPVSTEPHASTPSRAFLASSGAICLRYGDSGVAYTSPCAAM